jgi:E3 ubiquitin-protein ligase UHRF1
LGIDLADATSSAFCMAGDDGLSEYERQRNRNIAANNEVLKSLGLGGGGGHLVPKKQKLKKQPIKKKAQSKRADAAVAESEELSPRRKSRRLNDGAAECEAGPTDSREVEYEAPAAKVEKPADFFGELDDFAVGSGWETRADCCADLVHRATVAGIVGTPESGCYSIVLNGGYADDVDHGDLLTYTGSGGRSLKGTAANPKK